MQFEVLKWASLFLEKHHREPYVAELLLQHHLQQERAAFYANMRELVPADVVERWKADVIKHAQTGIPIQHIIGEADFYGRSFQVNDQVLIPRMETEELVERVIAYATSRFSTDERFTLVDVGTGSGIIAITLALELPQATVYAVDISESALEVASFNAKRLGADCTFLLGNFLEPIAAIGEKMQIIVSNPPYIAKTERDALADTVRDFDPELALFAADNGLAAYKKISTQVPQVLAKDGAVFLEIGMSQGPAVQELLTKSLPNHKTKVHQDINGKDRMVSSTPII